MNVAQNTASVGLAAIAALFNDGTLTIYSGAMPASPETALSGNTELVQFTFAPTAFGAPSFASGYETISASFANVTVNPVASGTAAFARAVKSDGTTVLADFTVGTNGTDIVLGSTTITTGVNVNILSFTVGLPAL